MEIVKLIGSDVLPDDQKLTIEIARVIRVGFLQQNAFHAVDTYVPAGKAAEDDGNHFVSVRQVPPRSSPSRCRSAVCWLTGLFDELVQMKYDRAQRRA